MSEANENKETVAPNEEATTEQTVAVEEQQDATEAVESAPEADETVEVDETEQKIAELEAKLQEAENRYLRLRADFDNMLRRHKLDNEANAKFRAQSLLTDLLPVLDNLDRALQVEVKSEDALSLFKGVEMVYKQLQDATAREGLEVIETEGKAFDPNFHQAVMQEQDSDKEAGAIVRELQKGYKLKDRVLRPSMVSVNE